MSRIRSVHPGLFSDEAFMAASAFARLLIIGIWTEAFDDGVFKWKPLTLKAKIFPVDSVDVPSLLAELETLNFIKRFQSGENLYGAIRNFRTFQNPKSPNSSQILPDYLRNYVGLTAKSSPSVPHQFPTSSEKSGQMERRMEDGEEKKEFVDEPPEAAPPTAVLEFDLDRKRRAEERKRLEELGLRWNALAADVGLPQIEEIPPGSQRERAALARLREGRDFEVVFAKIRGSPFLRGDKGSTPCSFNWITNPTNFLKIIEGNYDENRQAKRG